jgi:hypothetical protein
MAQASPTPARPPFSVRATVDQALSLLWRLRDDLLRLACVPFVATFAASALAAIWPGAFTRLVAVLASIALLMLFSVAWLRLLLLGPAAAGTGMPLRWSRRETTFLLRWVAVNLVPAIGAAVPLSLLLLDEGRSATLLGVLLIAAIVFAAMLIQARLSLVLPAVAVDHAYRLADSWRDTADCGVALLISLVLTNLPILICAFGLELVATATGLARAAPYTLMAVEGGLSYAAFGASLAVYSIAFRVRSGWPGPRQPPRPA